MSEKKRQTELGRQGRAVVRVPLDNAPAQGGAFGAGAQVRRAMTRAVAAAMPELNTPVARAQQLSVLGPVATGVMALTEQPVRVGLRDFFDGLVGNPKGGPKAPTTPQKAATPAAPAGKPGKVVMPPQGTVDPQIAALAAILGSNLTVKEAAAVTGMLPAPAKPVDAKDRVLGQTAQLSEAMFAADIAAATELEKTDPIGAKAMSEEAFARRFARDSGLVGFDPAKLAQAQLMYDAGGQE